MKTNKYLRTLDNLDECPIPVKEILNLMGISEIALSWVTWEEQEDGQIKNFHFELKPFNN